MRRMAAGTMLLVAVSAGAYDVPGMRDAMRSVFASMRVLLELTATPADLATEGSQRAMLEAAQEIADQAGIVSEHAPRDEMSFLASSLDRYAMWIRRSIEWRRVETTQRLVHDAVDVCVACHTRLPSNNDSPLAEQFLASDAMAALPAPDRVRLAIATRRFDQALADLESLLAARPAHEEFDDLARSYLIVALRVKRDPARARRDFEALAAREDLSATRRARLRAWAGALQRVELSPPVDGDLDDARELLRLAEARQDAAMGDALVDYVAASRVLYQYLEQDSGNVTRGAEAYYLLGLSLYRIEQNAWLPQAELFLEKAIRTAPASPHARRALALLRNRVEQTFTVRGEEIPEDVIAHLRMLQEMVESR